MRRKTTEEEYFDFSRESSVKVVVEYRTKYESMSRLLEAVPRILDLVHRDLEKLSSSRRGREAKYTTEQILRCLVVMIVEGDSYRDAVVRIEGSEFLRHFCRLGVKPMMDFTFLSKAFGCLSPETWESINGCLSSYAFEQGKITGEKLRVDTTAVETNIHYPTDSSLLWDSYRVLVRLLREFRKTHPWLVGEHRFHDKKVKRQHLFIARHAGKESRRNRQRVKSAYRKLIESVERVLEISHWVADQVSYSEPKCATLLDFSALAGRIIEQARRRVLQGEKVPADEKLYSLFEEHTELLIRGKARKPVEFGHMVLFGETQEKFISQYRVMRKKLSDKDLVSDVLASHERQFGSSPDLLAADKGFYENMNQLRRLEKDIPTVSICKKGRRTEEERERESTAAFKLGQRFRAGIEGTISVLKRGFKLARCLFKGFKNFASAVGASVFCHNLVALTRL